MGISWQGYARVPSCASSLRLTCSAHWQSGREDGAIMKADDVADIDINVEGRTRADAIANSLVPPAARNSWALLQKRKHSLVPEARRALEAREDHDIVSPHLDRSAPPVFIANNNVSLEGEFIVCKEGEPTAEELSNENLIKIVAEKCGDEQLNTLLWKCLGYRYDVERRGWLSDSVFPNWKERFPEPPDLLGVTRIYEREVDQGVMKAVQALVKSVPLEHKNGIREQLRPLGFSGFKLNELTPNRTRRAQATNFIIYFRESLWGVSLDELKRRRKERQETQARKPMVADDDNDGGSTT